MNDQFKKAIYLDKVDKALYRINKIFKHQYPWMYGFLSYKENGEEYIYQVFKSLPIISWNLVNKETIVALSEWSGSNIDKFWFEKKDDDKELSNNIDNDEQCFDKEIFGKKDNNKSNIYDGMVGKVKYNKYGINEESYNIDEFGGKSTKKPENYNGSVKVFLNSPKSIDIYEWGFRIITSSPIDMTVIKNNYFKSGAFNSRHVKKMLCNNMYESCGIKNFIPEEATDVNFLKYYWRKNDGNGEDIDEILFEKEINNILDVGQRNYSIIDI